jgi:hypothetical protein
MKIVSTLEENKPVNVKRFEGDLLVGERNVSVSDYAYSLMAELPFNSIFKHLIESEKYIESYLMDAIDFKDFTGFLKSLIAAVPLSWLDDDRTILTLATILTKKLNLVSTSTPEVATFVQALIKNADKITLSSDYYLLFNELIRLILANKDEDINSELQSTIFNNMMMILSQEQSQSVLNTIENLVPQLDPKWFTEMLLETHKKSKKIITYFSGKVPPKVDYIQSTSSGTYFIYDLPKAKVETKYLGQSLGLVGYPRMIFCYQMNEASNTVKQARIFALAEGDILSPDTTVYEYPYSHVFSNGSPCWRYDDITYQMLPTAHELFLAANNDNHGRAEVHKLFLQFQNRTFDDTTLHAKGPLRNVLK